MKLNAIKRRLPWEDRTPIYEYVQTHLNEEGIVYYLDWDLPDNVPVKDDAERYEPGVDDWMESGNGKEVDPAFIKHLGNLFKTYSRTGKEKDKIAIYNILKKDHVIGYWEDFVQELDRQEIDIWPYMQELSRWMVCKAPDRGVVKMGIILLGLTKDPDDLKLLEVIAKHEEFVYYVGEALMEMTPMWDLILVELINPLGWWGRLMCVELLAYNSEREEVKKWLVRYGHRKFFLTSFVSLLSAQYGDLASELQKEEWDKELLEAAQVVVIDLIRNLRQGYNLEFGGNIIRLYLKHELGKRESIMQYYILTTLLDFFEDVANDETFLSKLGLREEDYSDIWIDVNNEIKKTWYVRLKERRFCYSIDHYCSRAYDRNCHQ